MTRRIGHYNLNVIIPVGYRVDSVHGHPVPPVGDPAWPRDFATRGYAIDRQHMENGPFLGEEYFEVGERGRPGLMEGSAHHEAFQG